MDRAFGERVFFDYGDEIGSSWPSSEEKRRESAEGVSNDPASYAEKYDIIHGHYYASKYEAVSASRQIITFLRDPIERIISNYAYLMANPERRNADSIIVTDLGFSLMEFATYGDNVNFQTKALEGMGLSELAFVGVVEDYAASISRLNAPFDLDLETGDRLNVGSSASRWEVTDQERAELRRLNQQDYALYDAARERLARAHV